MTRSPSENLAKRIKRYDYDRYLTTLFASADIRQALITLYAFNLEIAKTAEVVSEPMMGQIRLQWWREAIEEIYQGDKIRQHEVVLPLQKVIDQYKLPKEIFLTLIEAREVDFEEKPFASTADFLTYTEKTGGLLLEAASSLFGPPNKAGRQIAQLTGQAWAIAGLIRALPFMAHQNHLVVPEDLLGKYEIKKHTFLQKEPGENLKKLVQELHSFGRKKLDTALKKSESVPKPIIASQIIANHYLNQIQHCGYNPYHRHFNHPISLMRLLWHAFLK